MFFLFVVWFCLVGFVQNMLDLQFLYVLFSFLCVLKSLLRVSWVFSLGLIERPASPATPSSLLD